MKRKIKIVLDTDTKEIRTKVRGAEVEDSITYLRTFDDRELDAFFNALKWDITQRLNIGTGIEGERIRRNRQKNETKN